MRSSKQVAKKTAVQAGVSSLFQPPFPRPEAEKEVCIWLAGKLDKNEVTVSRWCRNVQQPDLETLFRIAQLLSVPVCDLPEEEYKPDDLPG